MRCAPTVASSLFSPILLRRAVPSRFHSGGGNSVQQQPRKYKSDANAEVARAPAQKTPCALERFGSLNCTNNAIQCNAVRIIFLTFSCLRSLTLRQVLSRRSDLCSRTKANEDMRKAQARWRENRRRIAHHHIVSFVRSFFFTLCCRCCCWCSLSTCIRHSPIAVFAYTEHRTQNTENRKHCAQPTKTSLFTFIVDSFLRFARDFFPHRDASLPCWLLSIRCRVL